MNTRLFSIFSVLSFSLLANGKILERLVLKDGSVLEGHIVAQVPGQSITFESEVTTFVFSGSGVVDFSGSTECEVDDSNWKEWADSHKEQVESKGGKRFIRLSGVRINRAINSVDHSKSEVKDDAFKNLLLDYAREGNVKVLERGIVNKYVDIDHKLNISVLYQNISAIERVERPKDVISGVVDIIELDDGNQIRGQILSQKLGESITMLDDKTSEKQVILSSSVKCQKKEKLNEKQDFFQQIEYLDEVQSKAVTHRGIIKAQYLSKNAAENYILLETRNNVERIANSDIQKITKIFNEDYVTPRTDILISNDSIYLCRKSAPKMTSSSFEDKIVYADIELDSIPFVLSTSDLSEKKLVLEYTSNSDNDAISILPVSKKELKSSKGLNINIRLPFGLKSNTKVRYGFTFKELTESSVTPSYIAEVTSNNTQRKEYSLGIGIYMLYRPSDKMCILFEIAE